MARYKVVAAAATTNSHEQRRGYHTIIIIEYGVPENDNDGNLKQKITAEVTKFETRLVVNTQIMMDTSRKCTGILNMRF